MYDPLIQIAVVVPDEIVAELDRFVPLRFRSRAEAVRHALDEWLAAQRTIEVDRRYADAYALSPQSDDNIDAARVRSGRSLPQGWADLEW